MWIKKQHPPTYPHHRNIGGEGERAAEAEHTHPVVPHPEDTRSGGNPSSPHLQHPPSALPQTSLFASILNLTPTLPHPRKSRQKKVDSKKYKKVVLNTSKKGFETIMHLSRLCTINLSSEFCLYY
jgi:hypothetical protein